MSKEYNVMDNYVIFKELGSDSIGINYRAGEVEDYKPTRHRLLTVVHPFLATNPAVWRRIKILLEGIKKSNIPNLYSPERIEVREDKTTLVYPLLKGKTFEQVLEESTKKNTPINFDLAFSIAIAIADLIDTGASIVVSGKKSFHGFLTPDNIIIDYDGKIYLKNYGLFPYLNQDDKIFSEMVKKYGAWIAPEFLRKEKPIPQSDIYHLGYIIYRMLTGNYFSCLPDEDFDAKFSNITFTPHIDSTDSGFLTNIITFFKRTLHPDPSRRFANIREFKDFVSNNFKIEELSSVTFSLAYFMNSLYLEDMEDENKLLEQELAYTVPFKSEDEKKKDDALIENILIGLEEKEKAKSKTILLTAAIAIVAVIVAVIFYINMTKGKKEREQELERLRQQEQQYLAQLKTSAEQSAKLQQEMEEIKTRIATTEEEKTKRQEELDRIQREYQQRLKQEAEIKRKLESDRQKRAEVQKKVGTTEEQPTEKPAEDVAKDTSATGSETGTTPAGTGATPEGTGTTTTPAGTGATTEGTGTTTTPAAGEKAEPEKGTETINTTPALPAIKIGQLMPLNEVTAKPEKIAGKNPGSSYLLRKKYSGRSIIANASILVDEKGNVEKIKILGIVPTDIKNDIIKTVEKWKYKPAHKDNVNVKVWMPQRFTFQFK